MNGIPAGMKVLFIAGDFAEDYEVMVPYHQLLMVGIAVDVTSPTCTKDNMAFQTAIHDFEGYQTYTEKLGHKFTTNKLWSEVKLEEYDGIYIPGGRAPEYLRLRDDVNEAVKWFSTNNKVIAAVCHGPLLLASAGV